MCVCVREREREREGGREGDCIAEIYGNRTVRLGVADTIVTAWKAIHIYMYNVLNWIVGIPILFFVYFLDRFSYLLSTISCLRSGQEVLFLFLQSMHVHTLIATS